MLEAADRVLKLPYRGAPQTVSVIVDAALRSQDHLCIRQLAEEFCQGLESKDYCSEYLAIMNGVLQHSRYMRDPRTVELVKAPYVIASDILAGKTVNLDCDDFTGLIDALVLSVGGKCDVVTVAFRKMFYNGQQQFSHVFARAYDPRNGNIIVMDPVAAEKTGEMLKRVKAAKVWPIA